MSINAGIREEPDDGGAAVKGLVVGAEGDEAGLQSRKHALSVPPEPGRLARRGGEEAAESRAAPSGSGAEEGAGAGATGQAVTETRTREPNFSRFHSLHVNSGKPKGLKR